MEPPILYERQDDIAVLTINRPQRRNAMDWAAQEQFAAAVTRAAAERSLRLLIVTGAGERAFASGGDLKQLARHLDPVGGRRLNEVMSAALQAMADLPFPIMAAVNGDAVGGGCEILTACDLRLASRSARFRFAQVQMGLTTGWGGTARLVQWIGPSQAMELLLSGREIDAWQALDMGLVHRLAKPGETAREAGLRWAGELLALPGEAQAALKRLVHLAARGEVVEASAEEARLFTDLWGQPEHLAAMERFAQRRRTDPEGRSQS